MFLSLESCIYRGLLSQGLPEAFCVMHRRNLQSIIIMIPFLLSLIFHVFIFRTTDGQPLPYIPEDNFAVDCGSEGTKTLPGNRTWDGDVNSKLFPLEDGQNKKSIITSSSAVDQLQVEADEVPYGTARLSLSAFTYKIPVTQGPKFVRLHFLATAYQNFNHSNSTAYFSVKAGQFTLLSNFSVFLTAGAMGTRKVVKEFCVAAEYSYLTLSFSPSPSTPEAFAFVNGIEVVSMPTGLYYPNSTSTGVRFVGENSFYHLTNDSALETLYRINVGGYDIASGSDTGLFRSWYADDAYVTKLGYSLSPIETSAALKFRDISTYTAPENVYRTARSLGRANRSLIESYNLTWEYPVHAGFYYLVRFHFCEIVKNITAVSDRKFYIFIANQTAETLADVIAWSGGPYVPYKRDYVVPMFGKFGEKTLKNLSIALHANPEWISKFADAILNGLEIFKLNDTNGNLAGPNPDPITYLPSPSPQEENKGKSNSRTAIIAIVSGVFSGVVILFVLGFIVLRRARKVKDAGSCYGTTWWGPISFATTKSSKTRGSSSLPSDLCRYFSLAEIKAATNNFEDIFIIGVGGFGNVYKGYIDGGTTTVAIKRLKSESSQGAHEFKTEIEMLSHLRHRHLVSLIGYCNEDREMILVYDYMARGTLRGHLYNTENPPLTWRQRLDICIGAARGLHYLHTGAKFTIIHRDVKTTNILLDEKWVAKVSDFGLSKMGPTTMSKAHVTTVVKGSIGYLDPEYYKRQQLSEKSDVYSFGVVLCEVLCGRPPILRNAEKGQVSLAEWARSRYHNGTLHQIVDPNLTGMIAPECLKKYSEIAVNCMKDNGTDRPSMNDVVWGLEFAMQLQQNAEDNDRIGGALIEAKGEDEVALVKNNNDSDGTFSCSWEVSSELMKSSGATKISSSEQGSTTNESIKGMSGTVFSEINEPKAR